MNYYEQGLFNQILGSRRDVGQRHEPEVTYFVPVRPGQRRSYGNVGTCCGGTGMENHTKYQDSIYFRAADDSALYVNLYIPSTLDVGGEGLHDHAGDELSVRGREHAHRERQRSARHQAARAVVGAQGLHRDGQRRGAADRRETRHVRHAQPDSGAAGDRIEISMPFTFRAERTIDNPAVQSIFYGPTLLAVQHDGGRTEPRDRPHQAVALQALEARRRPRARDDAGHGAAALHDRRLHAGAVLRRRSVGRRRVAHDRAVPHVRAARRAADRVRIDRFGRAPTARARTG